MYNTVGREDFNMKIEKNIPMPDARSLKGGGKYGIVDRMEVGDSVLVEDSNVQAMRHRAKYKNPEKKFATRRWVKNYTRLWRIE
jgi:hypothetical protein|tara:strand:+ start:58 stop:309 length:252 start_codon:yes stop_codon:yes gene_type:complete